MINEGNFYDIQTKIIDIYMEGLINNDEFEQLALLNRFVNTESKKKYSVIDSKVIKPRRFPTVENSKFWKSTQDRLEKKRMAI